MMDDLQLDDSSYDGPGIQYNESGEESGRHTPSPDEGSPSEGESLQLEPPSEGGGGGGGGGREGASPPEPPIKPPTEGGLSPPKHPSSSERDSGAKPPEPPSRYPK